MAAERFLVTGVSGGLGAWVVKHLLDEGTDVVALGGLDDDRPLRLIASTEQLLSFRRAARIQDAIDGVTHVVATDAGSDAFAGVLSAAVDAGVTGLAFPSSMAVFPPSATPVDAALRPVPGWTRGADDLAKERTARLRHADDGLPSIGVRTNLVYGPAAPGDATAAIAASAEHRPLRLEHRGLADFQFVGDVAAALVAAARRSPGTHEVVNLNGAPATMAEFIQLIGAVTGADGLSEGLVEWPLPVATPGVPCPTALDVGIRTTVETLRWAPSDLI